MTKKMVGIRIEPELIDKLKVQARNQGIGYQALVRNILNNWINDEPMVRVSDVEKVLKKKVC